jgi:hypothetical protein
MLNVAENNQPRMVLDTKYLNESEEVYSMDTPVGRGLDNICQKNNVNNQSCCPDISPL